MHIKTTLAVWVCLSVILLAPLGASASLINKCLPENGGQLIAGDERIRDGDWYSYGTAYQGNSGGIVATIVWDIPCHVVDIGYSFVGAASADDNSDCGGTVFLTLCLNGGWTDIHRWDWRMATILVENHNDDNSGTGWDDVTGIQMRGSVFSYDTGTGWLMPGEIQVMPEPGTVMLLLVGAAVTLVRRHRHN